MIGERIRQARKARGLSLGTLAEKAGGVVSRQALFKHETGQATPGSTVLLALAGALEVPLDFFFRDAALQVEFGPLMCRKRARVGARRLGAICAQARDQVERRMELESVFPAGRFPKFRKPGVGRVAKLDDVEDVARATRRAFDLGGDPIENLIERMEDAGVKVVVWQGDEDGFDGFACWANGSIPGAARRGC